MRLKQSGKNTRIVHLCAAALLLLPLSGITLIFTGGSPPARAEEDIYGPSNLLKTMKTPFNVPTTSDSGTSNSGTITLSRSHSPLQRGLASRLIQSRLYLPGRMVLGKPAEFVVKGKPGQFVALAMADKNSGAKPVCGRELRLGSDRKLVAVGQIAETGVASLIVETPIQGDLIGERWFFEAALWTRPDFSDMELAQPVPADATAAVEAAKANGVLVGPDIEAKRGVRIVPDATLPMQRASRSTALDSGRP